MISLVPTPMMMMMMTTQKKLKTYRDIIAVDWPCKPPIFVVVVLFWFPFVERTFSHRIQNGVSMLLFIFLFNNKKREKRVNMSCPSNKTATSRAWETFLLFRLEFLIHLLVSQTGRESGGCLPAHDDNGYISCGQAAGTKLEGEEEEENNPRAANEQHISTWSPLDG